MSVNEFHELTVSRVRRLTDDAVCLTFAVPDALHERFRFRQGQYLTLRQSIAGEDVRYSLEALPACEPPNPSLAPSGCLHKRL